MTEIIIDGANVASINGTKKCSARRIEIAIGQLNPKVDCVKAVLPSHWFNQRERIFTDPDTLEKLFRQKMIVLINRNDDYYMVEYCVKNATFLLTNDKLRDHREREWFTPKHKKWAKFYLLEYEVINDTLLLCEKAERALNQAMMNSPIFPQLEMEAE